MENALKILSCRSYEYFNPVPESLLHKFILKKNVHYFEDNSLSFITNYHQKRKRSDQLSRSVAIEYTDISLNWTK